jgi:hypothetical protein
LYIYVLYNALYAFENVLKAGPDSVNF